MVLQTEVSRGQAQSVLTVKNPTDQPVRVRVYAQPFTYEREAGFTVLTEDDDDLTPYLQFSPREFVIPAGQNQRVRLLGLLPPSLPEPEYRAVVFTEVLLEEEPSAGFTSSIQTRIGSTVYFRQSDSDAELSVDSAEWNTENSQIQLLVNNNGSATARPDAKWTLIYDGQTMAEGNSGNTTVIAGQDRLLQLNHDQTTSELSPGNYELTGELVWRYGTEQHSQPFSTTFSIP
ncbi:MAG: P pilus assembly protein, chaperone PapD [Cyanobacteria bacterium P01_B01_bin.77]